MKKGRCPHDRVYRVRGPKKALAMVKDIDDEGRVSIVEMRGPVVFEVCERCGRLREIGFRRDRGSGQ